MLPVVFYLKRIVCKYLDLLRKIKMLQLIAIDSNTPDNDENTIGWQLLPNG